jgi:hypothetical protein
MDMLLFESGGDGAWLRATGVDGRGLVCWGFEATGMASCCMRSPRLGSLFQYEQASFHNSHERVVL